MIDKTVSSDDIGLRGAFLDFKRPFDVPNFGLTNLRPSCNTRTHSTEGKI